jgi:hypothetical protein
MAKSTNNLKAIPVGKGSFVSPKVTKFVKDWGMDPSSPTDVALTVVGGKGVKIAAKVGKRTVGGIAKAGAKYVEKIYRNIG